jgi:hypothetical protein
MSSSAPVEVRRCSKCQEPAVVKVFEWQHSYGQSTRDYRCQACGVKFSIPPKAQAWGMIIAGALTCFAVFPLGFVWWGWYRLTQEKRWPLVPGASPPLMRYQDGPPVRRCGTCQQNATLQSVTRHTSRGLPSGTEYVYACGPCNKTFTIESVWGMTVSSLAGLVLLAIGAGVFLNAESAGWKYGGSAVALLLAGFMATQVAVRISNRFKYPVVDERAG